MKAPDSTATKPPTAPATNAPWERSITSATPRPAPLFIPSTSGPARGLLKSVCSMRPATEIAAPAKSATTACGRRVSTTIRRHISLGQSPQSTCHTPEKGISTAPVKTFKANRRSKTTAPVSISKVLFLTHPFIILHFVTGQQFRMKERDKFPEHPLWVE